MIIIASLCTTAPWKFLFVPCHHPVSPDAGGCRSFPKPPLCRYLVRSFTILLPYFPTGTMERVDKEGQICTAKVRGCVWNLCARMCVDLWAHKDGACANVCCASVRNQVGRDTRFELWKAFCVAHRRTVPQHGVQSAERFLCMTPRIG